MWQYWLGSIVNCGNLQVMEVFRIVVSIIFCTISFLGILGNWYLFLQDYVLKRIMSTRMCRSDQACLEWQEY